MSISFDKALGISEQADVVVLVLSEETGHFSFAEYGKLSMNLTAEEMRERLTRAMTTTATPKMERRGGTVVGFRDYALESREAIDR